MENYNLNPFSDILGQLKKCYTFYYDKTFNLDFDSFYLENYKVKNFKSFFKIKERKKYQLIKIFDLKYTNFDRRKNETTRQFYNKVKKFQHCEIYDFENDTYFNTLIPVSLEHNFLEYNTRFLEYIQKEKDCIIFKTKIFFSFDKIIMKESLYFYRFFLIGTTEDCGFCFNKIGYINGFFLNTNHHFALAEKEWSNIINKHDEYNLYMRKIDVESFGVFEKDWIEEDLING